MPWTRSPPEKALALSASGQTWPALTNLFLGASSTATPKDITGTVDSSGKVELTLSYDTEIKAGSSECTRTGAVQLSPQGTEKLGGQAAGKNFDAATGQFAVVTTPAATGSCLLLNAAYDLSKGMGCYLTGTMTLPEPVVPPVAQKQTATVKVPKKCETGRRTPTPGAFVRLAGVLGLNVEDLEVAGPSDAEDLADLRGRLGLSQALAAGHLGIDAATLADVEVGLALPPDPMRMARVYGVTAEVLAAVARRTGCQGSA